MKDEPKSPSLQKRKVYSTTDSAPIRHIATSDFDITSSQGAPKQPKTGPSQDQFDGVVILQPTRTSAHVTKSTNKADIAELFQRLGQEFHMVVKTFKEISESMDKYNIFTICLYILQLNRNPLWIS